MHTLDKSEELFEYAKTLKVIDAHDHMISEAEHLTRYLSFVDYLYYVKVDLVSAGLDAKLFKYPENEEETLQVFSCIKPYWQYVKTGSYAKPVCLALGKYHGCGDFTEESVIKIGRDLNSWNKPGYYDRVFSEAGIEKILNQSDKGEKPYPDPRFVYCVPNEFDYGIKIREFFKECPDGSYDEYLAHVDKTMLGNIGIGAKLQKFWTDTFLAKPDEKTAREDFERMKKDGSAKCTPVLAVTVAYAKLHMCAKHGIVAAVHTGAWGNVTRLSPEILFPVVDAFKNAGTVFDIYHMGAPYVRESAFLGKNYPNVHLNTAWGPAVSEEMARSALGEWLDLIPVNKIFGFGGDLRTLPEHVWANLQVVLKLLADVFAERIAKGRMDTDYAKFVLRLWLYENAKRVYKL